MNCRWLKLTPTDPPKPRARGVQVTATHAAPSGADRPLRAPSSRGPGHGHGRGLRAGRWAQAEGPARLCRSHASSRGSPLAWPAASGLPSPLFPCVHPSAPLAPGLKKPLSVSWVCGLQARAVWPQPRFTATTGGRESQTAFGSWELLGPSPGTHCRDLGRSQPHSARRLRGEQDTRHLLPSLALSTRKASHTRKGVWSPGLSVNTRPSAVDKLRE